jgi:hypothetical protein
MTRTCSIAAALALTGALLIALSGAPLRVTATAAAQEAGLKAE